MRVDYRPKEEQPALRLMPFGKHSSVIPQIIAFDGESRKGRIRLMLAACPLKMMGQTDQLFSVIGANVEASAVGGGNSFQPVVSPDGRYVAFSSSADNLATNASGGPFVSLPSLALNVYMRDRIAGTTSLVSINTAGTGGGNDDSIPVAISTNARFVLFESSASNLVPNDTNGVKDIFVRDVVNGATTLVSVSTNGVPGRGASQNSAMTPDGRFVAFSSAAFDLVPGDFNGIADVFVRDLQMGTTTLASAGALSTVSGSLATNLGSDFPQMTPDGRYVAFYSDATNLAPGVLTSGEVYVRDLVGGTTVCASVGSLAIASSGLGTTNVISYNQLISDDGQYVAYEISPLTGTTNRAALARYSLISGLTDNISTNAAAFNISSGFLTLPGVPQPLTMTPDGRFLAFPGYASIITFPSSYIYVWDGMSNQTSLATLDIHNAMPATSACSFPVLDSSGRYVAFLCNATNLTTNTTLGGYHLYVRDLLLGTNTLVDADTNGVGSETNLFCEPEMTADGRFVGFESLDAGFVATDNNHAYDVFLRDLTTNTVELISARLSNLPSASPNGLSRMVSLSVSTNARYAAFMSDADNLVIGDANGCRDVFVRDLLLGTNILVSVDTNGFFSGLGMSYDPVISGDGRYVAFTSSASNLVAGDANNLSDIFVRDLQMDTTTLVSVSTNGVNPGNGASYGPLISSDGRYVIFHSTAQNLVPPSTASSENIFRRDLVVGATIVLSSNVSSSSNYFLAGSPDGRFVAFGGNTLTTMVWDMQSAAVIYTNTNSISAIGISANGGRLAFAAAGTGGQITAVDLFAYSNVVLGVAPATSHQQLRFSGDGRYLVYVFAGGTATNQIWCYDFQAGTNFLISRAFNSALGGYGNADSPDISSDGRFIAYRSFAANIVPDDTNNAPDVFLYDLANSATTLASVSRNVVATADNRSLAPVFSPDAQTLIFESWASDLAASDFNQSGDLFALSLYTTVSPAAFNIAVVRGASGGNPLITWVITPGTAYQVQFKNNLTDSTWQLLMGNVTLVGNEAFANDLTPAVGQRFYRVVAF